MPTALKLIAGLGNPGPQYANTRHNVGADWVRELARQFQIPLALDTKFKAEIGRGSVLGHDVRLLIPVTFMNNSGDSIGAVAHFYKWSVEQILIAHDEVAFAPGTVKLKSGGGENGHNGLKSVRACLANQDGYNRLRIGVGHPGNKSQVNYYLTQQTPTQDERASVAAAGQLPDGILRDMLAGNWQSAMTALHAPAKREASPAPNDGDAANAGSSNQQQNSGESDGI
ncbi:MAG: aminoacyl-tRNA hydrolase [Pseudomonadales bacterium]|nr:aminoacyl-tRNA hydrolase [Pseudomonadales bacterium]